MKIGRFEEIKARVENYLVLWILVCYVMALIRSFSKTLMYRVLHIYWNAQNKKSKYSNCVNNNEKFIGV